MNIGEVAERTGMPAKTVRYYEEIGLVAPVRGENGYRSFGEKDVHKLAFLSRARRLGFSIAECRTLLALYEDRERSSGEVKQIAEDHLRRIDEKIRELQSMRSLLGDLVEKCHGDDRPDCPIIHELAGEKP